MELISEHIVILFNEICFTWYPFTMLKIETGAVLLSWTSSKMAAGTNKEAVSHGLIFVNKQVCNMYELKRNITNFWSN